MDGAKDGLPGFEERRVRVKGVDMRYLVGGSGPPVVLLHGLGGAAENWVEIAPTLAQRRRVLAPDLPGHGRSSPLAASPSLAPFADRVAGVLEAEEAGPAAIVGHSLGGVVGLRLAIRRPELVTGVVLAAAAGISSATRRAEYVLRLSTLLRPGRYIAPRREAVVRDDRLRHLVFGFWAVSDPAAMPDRAVEGFLVAAARHTDTRSAALALVRDDPRLDLDRLRCPCLVLWGARDPQVPVEDGFDYARRLRAPIRVVADCGHFLIGERPDACLDAIEGFLDGL